MAISHILADFADIVAIQLRNLGRQFQTYIQVARKCSERPELEKLIGNPKVRKVGKADGSPSVLP